MRSKSYLFLLLVLGFGLLAGFFFTRKGFNLGLDVQGGVRFTYAMDTSKLTPEERQNIPAIRSRLLNILENRATGGLGVAEPTVAAKGADQFVIELPGFTDVQEARSMIGTSARIEFYHAKNIATPRASFRRFDVYNDSTKDDPTVSFVRRSDPNRTEIKPGTPEYAEIIKGWTLILSGTELQRAEPQQSGQGFIPLMMFSPDGARKMDRWSRSVANQGEMLAAVLDGKVLSIAGLRDGTILSDNAIIEGKFETSYVKKLTDLLNAGALPVDLKELSSEKIDPTIGKTALDKIVMAGAISFGLIALYLIAYYAFPGIVAFLALCLYVLFTLTVLKMIDATFSLAAIAGFILSVGMAVDANILVFERFKEEMQRGKSLQTAIELGFRRALPAIIDSNACTILTSLVLVNLGTGPVKGFATTLIIGVAISLFTAVFVTRSLLMFFVGSGIGTNESWYALKRNWFGERWAAQANTSPLEVVQKSKKWFLISLATVVVGLPFMFLGGFKPNVEFRGGSEASFTVADAGLTSQSIVQNLDKAGFKGGNVKLGSSGNDRIAYVTIPPTDKFDSTTAQDVKVKIVADAAGLDATKVRGFTEIGPTVQRETVTNALTAILVSSGLIIVYLAIRFGVGLGGFAAGLRFGVSAIGALVHDIFVVVGITAIAGYFFGWEISVLFITSMLTVIGFSVHDTIVIFDRIRENLHRPLPGENFAFLINRSITQSFARSINTSMTVIATLIIMIVAGTPTPDLKLFCVTMLAGILSGTYSSIYNASPILYLWDQSLEKKGKKELTLISIANAELARANVVATRVADDVVAPASTQSAAPGGRSYGQVRRRANSAVKKSEVELDD